MPARTGIPPAPPTSEAPPPDGPRAAQAGRLKWLVVGVAVFLLASAAVLLAYAAWQFARPAPLTALEILEQVKAEVVPAENTATNYGVAFNSAGYDRLVAWNGEYKVAAEWAADYEALDITLPCCAAAHPFADESKNCTCGHHQALYGLAKRLLIAGTGRDGTQAEIGRWVAYMYPKETLKAELERRALIDPKVSQALQELVEKGQC